MGSISRLGYLMRELADAADDTVINWPPYGLHRVARGRKEAVDPADETVINAPPYVGQKIVRSGPEKR